MSQRLFSQIHALVRREGAEQYLLYSLLAFALSVSGTRLFLELTGYPQLGNAELHIAHVLWGGLLLFVAALLPLLFANRWAYSAGGILSGLGVGLFIDEVGKFITQSNDYFYPAAAPIIYAFFLLVVLLYVRIRRPPLRDARVELYHAFDALQEVLDHDLDEEERRELQARLHRVAQDKSHPNHAALAEALYTFLEAEELELVPVQPSLEQRIVATLRRWASRWLGRQTTRITLIAGLLILAGSATRELIALLPVGPSVEQLLAVLQSGSEAPAANEVFLFTSSLVLESTVGILALIGALLLAMNREREGLLAAYFGLLISLTMLDVLLFYFAQFSTIWLAIYQFALLLGVSYYREVYCTPPELPPSLAEQPERLHRGQAPV